MDNGAEMVENLDPNESNGGVILSNNGVKRVKRAENGPGKLLPNDSKSPVMRGIQKMVPPFLQLLDCSNGHSPKFSILVYKFSTVFSNISTLVNAHTRRPYSGVSSVHVVLSMRFSYSKSILV